MQDAWSIVSPLHVLPATDLQAHHDAYHAGHWSALCPDAACAFDGYMDNAVYVGQLAVCGRCDQRSVRSQHLVSEENGTRVHARKRICHLCGAFVVTVLRPSDGAPYLLTEQVYPGATRATA